ncbi:hypothetical protein WA158_007015 [Blastocystis sp. Blastoise]
MKISIIAFLVCLVTSVLIEVPADGIICLFDELGINNRMNIRVDVLEGGQKDLLFTIDSVGRDEQLFKEELGDKMLFKTYVEKTGFEFPYFAEYKFCFDNKGFSSFAKVVQINMTSLDSFVSWSTMEENKPVQEEDIANIGKSIEEIQKMAEEIKGRQAAFRVQETDRRSDLASVHNKVSLTTIVEICVFIVFSVVQVYVVKSWFSGKTLLG